MATMTRKAFAEHMGWSPSYITKLAKEDRLVLTEDGKRVEVEASEARIIATRDPNRRDVAERHAAKRGKPAPAAEPVPDGASDEDPPDSAYRGMSHADAKTAKEFYLAENARLDYEERCGRLVPVEHVRMAVADATTTLRSHLESLPAMLAPQLVGREEDRIQALLAEHVESALTELSERMQRAEVPPE